MTRSSVMKMVAWVMVISLSQVFVLANRAGTTNTKNDVEAAAASAEMPLGRLVADGPVTINGVKARTGDTVFPGAQIQTVAGIGVTIQIGKIGQIDIAPDSNLVLNYNRESIHSNINAGCVVLATSDGVQGLLTMPGGITKKNDPLKSGALSACSDSDATAAAGAKSVKVGQVSAGAITLGSGSVSFAEFGSMMLGSTAMLTGLNTISSPSAVAAANGNCCCCCCCCNPSKSIPCP